MRSPLQIGRLSHGKRLKHPVTDFSERLGDRADRSDRPVVVVQTAAAWSAAQSFALRAGSGPGLFEIVVRRADMLSVTPSRSVWKAGLSLRSRP
jgi:hypothetical protein